MPFKDKTFDVIISNGVIEHCPETDKIVQEHSRVLKKGGIFVGEVPYRYTVFVLNKFFLKLIGKWDCGYEKSFSRRQWAGYFRKYGLKIEATKRAEIQPGIKHPWYGKILNLLDKPLWFLGMGGAHFYWVARKIA